MTGKLVIVTFMIMLVLFGCIGGNQTTTTTGTNVTANNGNNAASGNNVAANNSAGTSGNTVVSNASSGSSGSSSSSGTSGSLTDSFGSLFTNIGQANYKVSYDVTTSYGGSSISSAITQYVKGENMRYDSKMSYAGMTTESEIFLIGKTMYICTRIGAADFTCTESTSSKEDSGAPDSASIAESESQYNIQPLSDKTIAGISAKCFKLTLKNETTQTVDYCFSSDGIILYMKTDMATMTATAVERNIADSVFTLPATPGKAE